MWPALNTDRIYPSSPASRVLCPRQSVDRRANQFFPQVIAQAGFSDPFQENELDPTTGRPFQKLLIAPWRNWWVSMVG